MKIRLLALSLLLCSHSVLSESTNQVKIFVGGWSKHINAKGSPNEVHNNLGIGVNGFEMFYFKNSYSKDSFVIAKDTKFFKDFGVKVGVATGYEKSKYNLNGVVPVVQLTYDLEIGQFGGVQFGYLPYSGVRSNGVVSISTYLKF